MILSKIELGPEASESAAFWREVGTPYGAHQALWRLFGRAADQKRDFLFRQERSARGLQFLVLSAAPPASDGGSLWQVDSKPFAPALTKGQHLGFRLRANPVVRRGSLRDGKRVVKRHDLVMDRKGPASRGAEHVLAEPEMISEVGLEWLQQQGMRSGFSLAIRAVERPGPDGLLEDEMAPVARIDGYRQHRFGRGGRGAREHAIRFSTLDFEGELEVTEPGLFLDRVRAGFGPQKAFGCGLMLLRRA